MYRARALKGRGRRGETEEAAGERTRGNPRRARKFVARVRPRARWSGRAFSGRHKHIGTRREREQENEPARVDSRKRSGLPWELVMVLGSAGGGGEDV